MNKLLTLSLSFFTFLLIHIQPTQACTDFRITAKDGTILISRSMEFGVDMKSALRTSTRGMQYTTTAPDGQPGMNWKAKYGFIYLDGMNQNVAIDGMNENGLSFEYLYLPGETQYQSVPAGKDKQALPYLNLGQWILSNFKTVDEVRQALKNVYVFEQTLPGLGNMIFPVHASVYDTTGKGIVIEFVKGKMNIYENIGILTNSPTYNWQVNNLRNYLNLSPYTPQPVKANGLIFSVTGQGSGMVGLPGDASPPSRFTKMAVMMRSVYPAADAKEALNLGEHLINNVDIPSGYARTKDNGTVSTDTTEWVVFKDLTHKILYYRTYNDMTLHSIVMSQLDFSENAPRLRMPLAHDPYVMDMTSQFLNQKNN